MKRLVIGLAAAWIAAPAMAGEIKVKPLLDARLRWENVDQDGIPSEANAVTFRGRIGTEVKTGDWSVLGEIEGTAAIAERYFSGFNGKTGYPLVADPANFELNRLQLQYKGIKKTTVTAGRQRINIEDQRFVGSVGWRQNEQTFDAARIEYGDAKGLQADVTYAWSVRTIWGIDGSGARQQAIGGDNVFATASYPTPIGKLTGFAFLVDQDEAVVQNYRNSSQSYGVRLAGSRPLSKSAKVTYALSYARQSDYHRNPNDYHADYALAELGAEIGGGKLGIGYELLGADEGLPFTSFQTPLATLHKFQGWADKFLTTPPNGIQDYYAQAGYGWKKKLGVDAINALIVYHRFDSDRMNQHYGNEWNASLAAKKGKWTATAKLASYEAKQFATDTTKLWLQLEWAY
jgi:alginate export protein